MKRPMLALLALFVTLDVTAQGYILFQSKVSLPPVDAKILELPGQPARGGGVYTVELWAGGTPESLAPVGVSTPLTLATGYFLGGSHPVPGISAGIEAFFQLRVYETAAGSYGASLITGQSNVIPLTLTSPPDPPAAMIGLRDIPLWIPEPSVLALVGLGLGALLRRRRG